MATPQIVLILTPVLAMKDGNASGAKGAAYPAGFTGQPFHGRRRYLSIYHGFDTKIVIVVLLQILIR
jgi:hypothetical protein